MVTLKIHRAFTGGLILWLLLLRLDFCNSFRAKTPQKNVTTAITKPTTSPQFVPAADARKTSVDSQTFKLAGDVIVSSPQDEGSSVLPTWVQKILVSDGEKPLGNITISEKGVISVTNQATNQTGNEVVAKINNSLIDEQQRHDLWRREEIRKAFDNHSPLNLEDDEDERRDFNPTTPFPLPKSFNEKHDDAKREGGLKRLGDEENGDDDNDDGEDDNEGDSMTTMKKEQSKGDSGTDDKKSTRRDTQSTYKRHIKSKDNVRERMISEENVHGSRKSDREESTITSRKKEQADADISAAEDISELRNRAKVSNKRGRATDVTIKKKLNTGIRKKKKVPTATLR